MQVKWLAKALANLTDEADYIAKESPASAKALNRPGIRGGQLV
jgi:hypothetical protein